MTGKGFRILAAFAAALFLTGCAGEADREEPAPAPAGESTEAAVSAGREAPADGLQTFGVRTAAGDFVQMELTDGGAFRLGIIRKIPDIEAFAVHAPDVIEGTWSPKEGVFEASAGTETLSWTAEGDTLVFSGIPGLLPDEEIILAEGESFAKSREAFMTEEGQAELTELRESLPAAGGQDLEAFAGTYGVEEDGIFLEVSIDSKGDGWFIRWYEERDPMDWSTLSGAEQGRVFIREAEEGKYSTIGFSFDSVKDADFSDCRLEGNFLFLGTGSMETVLQKDHTFLAFLEELGAQAPAEETGAAPEETEETAGGESLEEAQKDRFSGVTCMEEVENAHYWDDRVQIGDVLVTYGTKLNDLLETGLALESHDPDDAVESDYVSLTGEGIRLEVSLVEDEAGEQRYRDAAVRVVDDLWVRPESEIPVWIPGGVRMGLEPLDQLYDKLYGMTEEDGNKLVCVPKDGKPSVDVTFDTEGGPWRYTYGYYLEKQFDGISDRISFVSEKHQPGPNDSFRGDRDIAEVPMPRGKSGRTSAFFVEEGDRIASVVFDWRSGLRPESELDVKAPDSRYRPESIVYTGEGYRVFQRPASESTDMVMVREDGSILVFNLTVEDSEGVLIGREHFSFSMGVHSPETVSLRQEGMEGSLALSCAETIFDRLAKETVLYTKDGETAQGNPAFTAPALALEEDPAFWASKEEKAKEELSHLLGRTLPEVRERFPELPDEIPAGRWEGSLPDGTIAFTFYDGILEDLMLLRECPFSLLGVAVGDELARVHELSGGWIRAVRENGMEGWHVDDETSLTVFTEVYYAETIVSSVEYALHVMHTEAKGDAIELSPYLLQPADGLEKALGQEFLLQKEDAFWCSASASDGRISITYRRGDPTRRICEISLQGGDCGCCVLGLKPGMNLGEMTDILGYEAEGFVDVCIFWVPEETAVLQLSGGGTYEAEGADRSIVPETISYMYDWDTPGATQGHPFDPADISTWLGTQADELEEALGLPAQVRPSAGQHSSEIHESPGRRLYVDSSGMVVGVALSEEGRTFRGIRTGDAISDAAHALSAERWTFRGNSPDDGLLASVYERNGICVYLELDYEANAAVNSGDMNTWTLAGPVQQIYCGYVYE